MATWLLIIIMTQPNSGGIDVQRFRDKAACEAAGEAIEKTLQELDRHSIRASLEWRCVEA